jgi:protease-4
MRYSFISSILNSPWQIEATTLAGVTPILYGMLNGIAFEPEAEAMNSKPYKISANSSEEYEGEEKRVINVLPVRGVILKHDAECGPRGTRTLANRLLNADADNSVIGHIMVIESGGGQSVAVPELTEAMLKCTKPIVVWVDGMMCSAAMYIGSYAAYIIASREMDRIGCIGTMIGFEGRKANSEHNNVVSIRLYATESTEKNDEYEEALKGNYEIMRQSVLDPLNEQFIADIKKNLPNSSEKHHKGKTFFAKDVLGELIDDIGEFSVAIDKVIELSDSNTQQQNLTNIDMKQFSFVNAALGVKELHSSDGYFAMNEEQLEAINEALGKMVTAGNSLKEALKAKETAENNLAIAQGKIAQKDAKIKELEQSSGAKTSTITKETDTISNSNNEDKGAETNEEAYASCMEFLNMQE